MLDQQQEEEANEIFKSFRLSRVLIPIVLGLGAIFYMLYRQFDPRELTKITWTVHTTFWLSLALLLLIGRHLMYSLRLYIIADGLFTYRKCIELLFIWEFSGTIAPTNAGGAAVALFVLTLEKIPPAKTAVIIIYKILLDSIFYFTLFPTLFLIFGFKMLRPNMHSLADLDGWGYSFLTVYGLMTLEGILLGYGIFINPFGLKNFLGWMTKFRFLQRFQSRAVKFGEELIIASKALQQQPRRFHLRAFGATAAAWTMRFSLIVCLIIGIQENIPTDFFTHATLFARSSVMYIVTLFSPTPGGAGLAEVVFGGFFQEYVSPTVALMIALLWRVMTYYSYLIAGAIVIPNWIRKLIKAQ